MGAIKITPVHPKVPNVTPISFSRSKPFPLCWAWFEVDRQTSGWFRAKTPPKIRQSQWIVLRIPSDREEEELHAPDTRLKCWELENHRMNSTGPLRLWRSKQMKWIEIPGLVNIQKTMENHHVYWENPLCQWPFSIVFCMFARGYPILGG